MFASTDSGVSAPGLSAGVLPGAMPLYFFDTDTTIEIVMSRVDEPTDFTVIATVDVGQVIGQGGIEVTGSVQRQDVTATILSRREFAERMSIDESQLDSLRDRFLSL